MQGPGGELAFSRCFHSEKCKHAKIFMWRLSECFQSASECFQSKVQAGQNFQVPPPYGEQSCGARRASRYDDAEEHPVDTRRHMRARVSPAPAAAVSATTPSTANSSANHVRRTLMRNWATTCLT